jgi:predicted CoA-substrate-specific enzyme activase
MTFAGIDAGSRAIKCLVMDENRKILNTGIIDQGIKQYDLARDLLNKTCRESGTEPKDITCSIATGYGRDALDFVDMTITEITCHARGVYSLMSEVQTIIDIGGQDSKVIRLNSDGKVRDFVMNERCAAGTGRFLEVVAERLEIPIDKIGSIAQKAKKPSIISSMCVVFAETEIIGLLASGENPENIVSGVQKSIASRIATMTGSQISDPVIFTGGVALIPGMHSVLEEALGHPVTVSRKPQFTGALGAALLAMEEYSKKEI